jgi:hypothetical protein
VSTGARSTVNGRTVVSVPAHISGFKAATPSHGAREAHSFTPQMVDWATGMQPADFCCAGIGGGEICGKSRADHPDASPGGAREAVALLADLRDRLARADSELTAMAEAARGPSFTKARIGGKRDGIRLALSYLDEIERSQHV